MLTLKQLRDVIVDALKTRNILSIGGNVFSCRTESAWNDEGNFICVYTNNNKFDDGDRSPVVYRVTSDVIIDVVVQGANTFDIEGEEVFMGVADQMDFITQKVLDTIVKDKTDFNLYANLPFKKVRVESVQNTLAGDGEFDKGTQRISLSFTWYMQLPMPSVPDSEFLNAHTKIEADDGVTMEFDTETRRSNQ